MPRLNNTVPKYHKNTVPKYHKHKASGQAIVTIAGHGHNLGRWRWRASLSK